jgi:hypothetical protein
VVIGLSVLLVHLPEKQHLRHISGFSRELVCRVHLGSIGGSHILPPCTTCLESKVVRTHMGVSEDTKVTKELITHFQTQSRLWNQIPCYCGALWNTGGATVELMTFPARVA